MEKLKGSNFLGDKAESYNARVPLNIPGYEAMHGMACALLQCMLPQSANLLVIGAGTGKELCTLGEANPGWRFTGVDPSPDMLAVARETLAERGMDGRVQLHEGKVEELPEAAQYDGATSLLVMHFMPDDGTKAEFLAAIAARLKPGAPLILVDQHGQRPSMAFDDKIAVWKRLQLNLGMAETDVEENMTRRLGANHYVSEERIRELLHGAGFENVERFYQALVVGGWSARRI